MRQTLKVTVTLQGGHVPGNSGVRKEPAWGDLGWGTAGAKVGISWKSAGWEVRIPGVEPGSGVCEAFGLHSELVGKSLKGENSIM